MTYTEAEKNQMKFDTIDSMCNTVTMIFGLFSCLLVALMAVAFFTHIHQCINFFLLTVNEQCFSIFTPEMIMSGVLIGCTVWSQLYRRHWKTKYINKIQKESLE